MHEIIVILVASAVFLCFACSSQMDLSSTPGMSCIWEEAYTFRGQHAMWHHRPNGAVSLSDSVLDVRCRCSGIQALEALAGSLQHPLDPRKMLSSSQAVRCRGSGSGSAGRNRGMQADMCWQIV